MAHPADAAGVAAVNQPSLFEARPHAYVNTTDSTADELARYERQARTQEDRILAFFRSHEPGAAFTPSQISIRVMPEAPLTSVRRAMTRLTGRKRLHRKLARRTGPYGRPEHFWTLAPRNAEVMRPACLNDVDRGGRVAQRS